MSISECFEITVTAVPENVSLVRHALDSLKGTDSVDDQLLSDVKLATSEACTNVVVHAYPREAGPLNVLVDLDGDRLTIRVRDRGKGIKPRTDSPGLGVGLPLITSLTASLRLTDSPEWATDVLMTFSLNGSSNRWLEDE